ncbi:MAG: endonuclease/exonuclease/phosphatase family protein [Nocardioides sp.]
MTGERTWSERRAALVTAVGVTALVGVVVAVNIVGQTPDGGEAAAPASPVSSVGSASPTAKPEARRKARREARRLARMAPEEVVAEAVEARPPVAPPGAKELAEAAEAAAAAQPFSFVLTTFNILGSQHSAPGGAASEYADGLVRTRWAAELVASYGSDVVGFGELQADQYAEMTQAAPGFSFYPGTSLGQAGVPTNLMWRTDVWESTYQTSVTIPFVDSTRPMPIVRLRHRESGREIYVMNVHNSPKDSQGREPERDQAEAIEIAAVNELAKDGIPIFWVGDFNEHAEIFCRVTAETTLVAASGGANLGGPGGCRPPAAMRVDWIFGSAGTVFTDFLIDTSPAVRRTTDHAVLTTGVTVPAP